MPKLTRAATPSLAPTPARLALAAAALLAAASPAAAEQPLLPRLLVSVPAGAPRPAPARPGEPALPATVAPEVTVDFGEGWAASIEALRGSLAALPEARPLRLHLRVRVGGAAGTGRADEAALEQRVNEVASALPRGSEVTEGFVLEIDAPPPEPGALQFAVAALVLQLRAGRATPAEVALVFPPGLLRAQPDLARRLALYADLVGVTQGPQWRDEAAWVRDELRKPVLLKVDPAPAPDPEALGALLLDDLAGSGRSPFEALWTDEAGAAVLRRSVHALSTSLRLSFAAAGGASVPFVVVSEGEPLAASAFVDTFSSEVAFLVRAGGSPTRPQRLTVSAEGEAGFDLACRDALDGHPLPVSAGRAEGGRAVRECRADGTWAVLSALRGEGDHRVYESVNVTGEGGLKVEEIVARWQQQRAAQQHDLANLMASCLLSLHFEAAGLGTGFDIALQLRQFADNQGHRDWVQEGFFVNGVRYKDARGFPLPQLEPEKVLAQPLELTLEQKYRYTLEGVETVEGRPAYVVGVTPESPGELLFSGKVWIDGTTFRHLRMQLQQSGGRSSIRSHAETQEWALVEAGGRSFNLPRSIYVQQILSAAGRNVLLERTYEFSGYEINTEGFAAALAQAAASDKRMFRDTDEGLRVLRLKGGERVVEPSTKTMRSLLLGTLYEGTYDYPIPLAGLSLVDYDFRGTGSQLSLFFAGVLGAVDLSKQVHPRLRLAADLSLTAIAQDNRVYLGDEEVEAARLRTREETVGVLGTWQALPSLSLTGSSYLSANLIRPAEETSSAFSVSATGFTVQTTAELKAARRGFSFTGNITSGDRFHWPVVGEGGTEAQAPASHFWKWSGELSKQFFIGSFSKAAVNGGYYGGDRLDRFSRYQPSFLSRPRIRGIPGGTDTFDSVGVVGVQYGFNLFEAVKVDAFYNRAWGRNLGESREHQAFDGLELDLGTVGPWGTYVQGMVTYALSGNLARYNSRWGAYLLVFRPFGR